MIGNKIIYAENFKYTVLIIGTFEARINMYLMKTLNTDRLSLNLTLKRSEEKHLRTIIESFNKYFDYIFIDFPPSSSRLSEILLDISQSILIVVGLDTLGLQGFSNTIQYFVDTDIDLDKIRYIIPVGYIKGRRTWSKVFCLLF